MENPKIYSNLEKKIEIGGVEHSYFDVLSDESLIDQSKYSRLPFSIRILLESAVRNCDNFQVSEDDVKSIVDWEKNQGNGVEIRFRPARVILQDFTGVPAVVDFAAMRDAVHCLGKIIEFIIEHN